MAKKRKNSHIKLSKNAIIGVAVALLVLLALFLTAFFVGDKQSNDDTPTAETCVSDSCLEIEDVEYPVSELPENVVVALNKAIDDEYKAHDTYEAVIAKFGQVRPFIMIVRAEETHIASLKALYDKYGMKPPSNPYENLKPESTIAENCQVGVEAEIANVKLYKDELLPVVQDYPDISNVFTNLMNASNDKHLPAFQRCAN